MKTGILALFLTVTVVNAHSEDIILPSDAIVALSRDDGCLPLTTRLCQMLSMAESLCGPQTTGYALTGWQLTTESNPDITFYPISNSRTNVIVQLTTNCFAFPLRAEFQMSHEVIHALSPRVRGTATVFEEGVAVFFSVEYCRSRGSPHPETMIGDARYISAYQLVDKMLQSQTNAISNLHELRQQYGSFSAVPINALEKSFPKMSHTEIQILSAKW